MTHASDPRPASVRAAVALALYGQADPDHLTAAGLHGLGGAKGPIALTQAGPCRFTVAMPGRSETIDFGRVSTIRDVDIADPAAGLSGMFAPPLSGAAPVRRLKVAMLDGSSDAVCGASGCRERSVFAIGGPDQASGARRTAVAMLAGSCLNKSHPGAR